MGTVLTPYWRKDWAASPSTISDLSWVALQDTVAGHGAYVETSCPEQWHVLRRAYCPNYGWVLPVKIHTSTPPINRVHYIYYKDGWMIRNYPDDSRFSTDYDKADAKLTRDITNTINAGDLFTMGRHHRIQIVTKRMQTDVVHNGFYWMTDREWEKSRARP